MLMWGVGKDEMKGKHVLPTTVISLCYVPGVLSFTTFPDWVELQCIALL